MPLGADHAGQITVENGKHRLRLKRLTGAKDEGRDAVFRSLGGMVGKTIQLLGPHRVVMGLVIVEQARVQDGIGSYVGMIRLYDLRIGIEATNDLARRIRALGPRIRHLVQHDHFGEFDLLDQQVDQRALVLLPKRFAAVAQEVVA